MRNPYTLLLFLVVGLLPMTAQSQTPRDVRDLVDARASSGERALEDRGYVHIKRERGGDRSYSYWWKASDRECVVVQTADGRYRSLASAHAIDCNQSESNHHDGSGAAAAVVVGGLAAAAIIGAIAHSSHHHDDGRHRDDNDYERDYERGYRDGLHNHSYDNHNDTAGYMDGYQAGVEQRDHNTSYRHHSGRENSHGYRAAISDSEFQSLNGARASSADGSLRQWGFSDVDGFTSGNARYTIWYNRSTRQCVQMATADGRAEDVRDIHTHPACH